MIFNKLLTLLSFFNLILILMLDLGLVGIKKCLIFKTELGQNALQQRDSAFARQRRLLLLIDHEDFQELDHGYKERIAPTELVQQLIDMGLLANPNFNFPITWNCNFVSFSIILYDRKTICIRFKSCNNNIITIC
jgi:hypothetical protein